MRRSKREARSEGGVWTVEADMIGEGRGCAGKGRRGNFLTTSRREVTTSTKDVNKGGGSIGSEPRSELLD